MKKLLVALTLLMLVGITSSGQTTMPTSGMKHPMKHRMHPKHSMHSVRKMDDKMMDKKEDKMMDKKEGKMMEKKEGKMMEKKEGKMMKKP